MSTTYSTAFQQAIRITLQNEGGLVNNPADPGGLTKFGISQRSYPTLDIRNLTVAQATAIYYRDFWSKYPYDQIIFVPLACKVFDTCVNLGQARGIKLLQRCLQVNGSPTIIADGGFGPGTLKAINNTDGPTLIAAYRGAQAAYYNAVVAANPQDQQFLRGWLARAAQ